MKVMRISQIKPLLAILLCAMSAFPCEVWAWGNSGHEAVACVAWQQMKPATRTRILQLLKRIPAVHPTATKSIPGFNEWVSQLPRGLSEDEQNLFLFMRAATWPDTIKHVGFQDSDVPPPGVRQDVNIGFSDKASHGYWHFVDAGFASDHSTVPATPAPNARVQIIALREAIASSEDDDLKAYDLIWLEHLVGDIHQPLHGAVRFFNNQGDRGGNLVEITLPSDLKQKFGGSASSKPPTELHAFWDDLPGEGEPDAALGEAETFAKALPSAPSAKVSDTDPTNWGLESFTLAKTDGYAPPIGKGPKLASSHHSRSRTGNVSTGSSYLITDAYYQKAMQDAKDRIALAGARLAKLLDDNLK